MGNDNRWYSHDDMCYWDNSSSGGAVMNFEDRIKEIIETHKERDAACINSVDKHTFLRMFAAEIFEAAETKELAID